MLILTRRKSEAIVIDHRVVVTVVEIRGEKVRLGIEAPRGMAVHREEIELRIADTDGEDGTTEGEQS